MNPEEKPEFALLFVQELRRREGGKQRVEEEEEEESGVLKVTHTQLLVVVSYDSLFPCLDPVSC